VNAKNWNLGMKHNIREVGGMLLGHVCLHQEHDIPRGSSGL